MSYYTSNEIFCSYLLYNQKSLAPQVIIYCQITMEKKYGYMIIHNSYVLFIPLSVECIPYEKKIIFSTQVQPTESKFISMSELAKEFTAQYSVTNTFKSQSVYTL